MDFTNTKEELILSLKNDFGIHNVEVLEALKKVPREEFLPVKLKQYAYLNKALLIAENQTISQPLIVALMTQALDLAKTDKVLEIGTGSGYQAAILSLLSQKVVSIEYFKKLANTAKKRLEKLKYMNVLVVNGDGRKGFEQEAPFDKVIITAGSEEVPKSLIFQLKAGGILVAPIGPQGSQRLLKFVKKNGGVKLAEDLGECQFVPLLGKPIFGTLDMGK